LFENRSLHGGSLSLPSLARGGGAWKALEVEAALQQWLSPLLVYPHTAPPSQRIGGDCVGIEQG